ncbi:MAG: extracellular solute-binding protein [Propioniciclava sp.]|uniref:extracellular solute-binding protein n=1 Tax=Propioniciclava sp. TaxID=2038686 RepID=UPI0039E2343E
MRIVRRSALAVVAAAGLALSLVACSTPAAQPSGTPASTASAPASSLVIYSGRGEDLVGPLIAKFEQTSGIKADVRYAGSAEQAQLLLTEGANTPAQVFLSQEAGALGLLGEAGLLSELPAEVLSKVPDAYSADDDTWVGVTGRARVVAYDSQQVDEADVPTTAAAIVDPRWSGQVGIAPGNASFLAFVTAMRLVDGEDATKQWLGKLAANQAKSFARNGAILEAVDKGEVKLGLINHYYWYSAAAERGADTMRAKIKFGASGDVAALVNATGVGILAPAASNPSARAFVDFLLSQEAQSYFVEHEFEYPLVTGIAGPAGVPPLESLRGPSVDLSDLGTVKESAALVDGAGLTVG